MPLKIYDRNRFLKPRQILTGAETPGTKSRLFKPISGRIIQCRIFSEKTGVALRT